MTVLRNFLLILLTAMLSLISYAQNPIDTRLAQIRTAYAERLNLMNNQPYDDGVKIEQLTVSYNRMYPGTGLYRENDTYYWTDDEDEVFLLKPTLYFVTTNYTMASGIYRFYREYLFDSETEEPMFLLITTQFGEDEKPAEYRFYFDKGKIIKQIPEQIGPFDDDAMINPYINVDEKGRAIAADLLNDFEQEKALFHRIIDTMTY